MRSIKGELLELCHSDYAMCDQVGEQVELLLERDIRRSCESAIFVVQRQVMSVLHGVIEAELRLIGDE